MEQQGRGRVWIFCVVTAALLLAICSKCSFLYPLNDWVDANIYFTVGKGLLNGKVLYRDIYDHKGPLLYFLHAIAAVLSRKSFLGVYWIEIVAFTMFLMAAWKILRLYCENSAIWMIPLLGAVILSSQAFCHGDSAEEMCLPILMWSLYESLRYFKKDYPHPMSYKTLFLHGCLAGAVLWIKYTMLGFHFAWMMMVFFSIAALRDWKRSMYSCLVFLAGMSVTVIPWLLYFGWNSALTDLFKVYFYDNIFVYGSGEPLQLSRILRSMISNVIRAFRSNGKYSVFVVAGLLWHSFSGKNTLWEKGNVLALFSFMVFGICWGVVQWQPYYPLVIAIFAVLGFSATGAVLESRLKTIPKRGSALVALVAAVVLCVWTGNYTDQIGREKSELVQYQFADQIMETEDATLLNYGFLDSGFYTVCGNVPDFKYFCRINIPLAAVFKTQEKLVLFGEVDYVITRGFVLQGKELRCYEKIAHTKSTYEGIEYDYYLYRNRALGEEKTER